MPLREVKAALFSHTVMGEAQTCSANRPKTSAPHPKRPRSKKQFTMERATTDHAHGQSTRRVSCAGCTARDRSGATIATDCADRLSP